MFSHRNIFKILLHNDIFSEIRTAYFEIPTTYFCAPKVAIYSRRLRLYIRRRGVGRLVASVCLLVFPCSKRKTAWAISTKVVDINTW